MGDLDFDDCAEVWIPKPIFTESTDSFNTEDMITFNAASSVLDSSYYRYSGDMYSPDGVVDKLEWWVKENGYKKEDIPEMKLEETLEPKMLGHRYAVSCHNYNDLSQDRVLKSIAVMKSKLMMKCMPYRIDSIECRMSPFVKKNIVNAYRKLSMYGKKTPFVARFDEYGRRLPDEIKIDTMRGMNIKIIDPDVYGENYLVFEALIPDNAEHSPLDYDADLPF